MLEVLGFHLLSEAEYQKTDTATITSQARTIVDLQARVNDLLTLIRPPVSETGAITSGDIPQPTYAELYAGSKNLHEQAEREVDSLQGQMDKARHELNAAHEIIRAMLDAKSIAKARAAYEEWARARLDGWPSVATS